MNSFRKQTPRIPGWAYLLTVFLCLKVLFFFGQSAFGGVRDTDQMIVNFFHSTPQTNYFRLIAENEVYTLLGDNKNFKIESAFRKPRNDFRQEVILTGTHYFVSEVRDNENQPLFIYGTNNLRAKIEQVSDERLFSVIDAVPYYYRLFANNKKIFRDTLSFYGINSYKLQIKKINGVFFYLLGNDKQGLLLDSVFRPIYIRTVITVDAVKVNYEIRFEEFDADKPYFPVKTGHYFNGERFMTSRVKSVDFKIYKTLSRVKYSKIKS